MFSVPQFSQRQLRVGEQIRHSLAMLVRELSFHDAALTKAAVNITRVEMSPDLKQATIFYMPLAGRDAPAVGAALAELAPQMQSSLARMVKLKFTPKLRFQFDESMEHATAVESLLRSPEVTRDLHKEGSDESL